MPKVGDVIFGGSRFIFWTLSPILLLFVILSPFFPGHWSVESAILVVGLDVLAVLLILALYKPKRFRWARRAATGLVFLAFVAYLIDEIASSDSWYLESHSEPTPLNALLGLLFIGVPCLRYAIVGRFGRNAETHTEDTTMNRWLTAQCTQCPQPLSEHDWAMFACTVASEMNMPRLTEFFNKVKEHDWRSVATFTDFDATENDMLVHAVRCESGDFVFVLRSPYELWEDDELYLRESVTAAEMSEIERLIPSTSWHFGASSKNK